MQNLLLLQDKLTHLLRAFSDLETENKRLQKTIDQLNSELEKVKSENHHIEGHLKMATLGQINADLSEEEKSRLREELDQVILELDRNITLLK